MTDAVRRIALMPLVAVVHEQLARQPELTITRCASRSILLGDTLDITLLLDAVEFELRVSRVQSGSRYKVYAWASHDRRAPARGAWWSVELDTLVAQLRAGPPE